MKVLRTIELGQYAAPHGIAFLPGDSLVAVTSEVNPPNVIIVHVATGEIRKVIPTNSPGSHMIGVTGDGTRGYTSNGRGNSVSQLDLTSGAFLRTFPVPAGPEAINVTPDGKEVWVGSNTTHVVSVLDPETGRVSQVADSVAWPYRVLFSPDARTVIIPDMTNETVRFIDRASRRELSRIALPGAGPQGILITPDAKYVFLSLSKQAKVAIIDTKTRAVVGHLAAGNTPDGIVYTTRVLTGGR
jgi:DNA-binding beta-propeller fold protein YncE